MQRAERLLRLDFSIRVLTVVHFTIDLDCAAGRMQRHDSSSAT
jgi:hypothetical protein